MRLFRRVRGRPAPPAESHEPDVEGADPEPFVCSTCGRSDLPSAGDWDPPICLECDAEINFAAIEEVEIMEDL